MPELPPVPGVTNGSLPPSAPAAGAGATVDGRPAPDGLPAPPTAADGALAPTIDYVLPRTGITVKQGSSIRPDDPNSARAEAIPSMIAGYEILGVLGRGAMGVVYKARQPGLNRTAALKMILAGGHASVAELARFRSEAEAVARLRHPNIVQIYEVGDEGGRPFISLEYLDGGNLAQVIDGTPQPPRCAANLVHLLAGAMAYAHAQGIVHRDLKPGNILLQIADCRLQIADLSEQSAIPKITDFGLAKRLDGEPSALSDPRALARGVAPGPPPEAHTYTGAILGTPGYMAPEQAEGRNHEVGPPADIYAIGAILYELLTGRAPFKAATILETLEQVRTQEPVAPAHLQPKVPRDLETICLKCLQKEPIRRYPDAGALAEDLRRFLAGEPIRARPVSRLERAWRWCRRNPGFAALTGAIAALVVAWAVTSSILAMYLKAERDETERARATADANARTAENNEAQAKQNAARADHNAAIAERNETQAKQNAARADHNAAIAITKHQQAIQRMVSLAEDVQKRLRSRRLALRAEPEIRGLRDSVIDLLRRHMLALAEDLKDAQASSFTAVAGHQQLGDLLARLGQGEEALRQFQEGYQIVRRIAAAQPNNDQARANLGVMLIRLANMALDLSGDARAACAYLQRARALQQEIADYPRSHHFTELRNKILLSHYDAHLGKAELRRGDPAAARRHFQQCLTLRTAWTKAEPRSIEARSYVTEADRWLGTTAAHLGDTRAARDHFQKALRGCAALAREFPRDFSFQGDLAEIHGADGDARLQSGKPEAAQESYQAALRHLEAILAHDPDDIARLPLLAETHERLARVAQRLHKPAAAAKHAEEALKLRRELLQTDPGSRTWQAAYTLALARCGKVDEAARRADQLRPRVAQSAELLLQAARCYAVCAAATADPASKKRYLAAALDAVRAATQGDYKDAVVLETDPDLEVLRGEPAYQAVLVQVRKRS